MKVLTSMPLRVSGKMSVINILVFSLGAQVKYLTGFLSGSELLWGEGVGTAHEPGVLECKGTNGGAAVHGGPGGVIGV